MNESNLTRATAIVMPAAGPRAAATTDVFMLSDGPLASVSVQAECLPMSDDYLRAQETERRRLGRELHDSTGQLLLALKLSVAHLREIQGLADTEEILSEIDDMVGQIDSEIRTFSFLNYPSELGKCGLLGALQTLTRGFGRRTGVHIDFQSSCKQPCSGDIASALLRVAQEALMNIHRHAGATTVRVSLEEHDGILELSVRDDGRGMPSAGHYAVVNGVGLQGMRHRIERLGGRFVIRRLKHGTKVVASLQRSRFTTADPA